MVVVHFGASESSPLALDQAAVDGADEYLGGSWPMMEWLSVVGTTGKRYAHRYNLGADLKLSPAPLS